jgi:MFS family permease
LGIGRDVIPLVYAVINISHTAIGIPTGVLADRIGKEKVLTIGYAVFAVSSSLMIIFAGRGVGGAWGANNFLYACILAAVLGIYVGISETLQRAIIPKYVSSELRGTAYGIYNVVIGSGFFISNIVFGYLWDNFNLLIAVLYSISFAFAAIVGMLVFIKKLPLPKSK